MCEKKDNQNKIDALTDNMISCMKINEESDKKLVKRIRLMPEIKKNYDFVAKNETSVESEYFCAGFVEGAEWKINSAWHDAKEIPKGNNLILFKCKRTCGETYTVNYAVNYKIMQNVIISWAYIKDLIPMEY